MKIKVGDVVKVINPKAFFYKVMGEVANIIDDEIYVEFKAIDIETEEVFVYEDCVYLEEELEFTIIYKINYSF